MILSTRNTVGPGRFGLGRREYVEVVAALPEASDELDGTMPLEADLAAHDFVTQVATATARDGAIATDAALIAETAGANSLPPRPAPAETEADEELAPPFVKPMAGSGEAEPADFAALGAEPPSDGELLAALASEVSTLRSMMERFMTDRVDRRVEVGPPALRELRERMRAQEIGSNVIAQVLDRVAQTLAPDASPEAARQIVERRLAAELPPPGRLDFARLPVTIFVAGPAGAGKTTAAARLGLRLQDEAGLNVTLAGIDVDRVGAPQELEAYGSATGVGVRVCYTPGELQALVNEQSADVVIVDAAGHDGSRRERMAELQAFANAVKSRTLLLTLPATMRSADARRVTAAYQVLRPDGLLLTRCDETETFGGALTIAIESGLGVAYTTHSPSVREPAREGDNHAFARAALLGRWGTSAAMTSSAATVSAAMAGAR